MSNIKNAIEKNAAIGFVQAEKRIGVFTEKNVKFEVNIHNARARGLRLDPMLLELAERIIEGGEQ